MGIPWWLDDFGIWSQEFYQGQLRRSSESAHHTDDFFQYNKMKNRFSVKLECFCFFSDMFLCLSGWRLWFSCSPWAQWCPPPFSAPVPCALQRGVDLSEPSDALAALAFDEQKSRAQEGVFGFCFVLLLGGLKNGKHVEVGRNARILDVRVNINVRMLGS